MTRVRLLPVIAILFAWLLPSGARAQTWSPPPSSMTSERDAWRDTLDRVVEGVVSIRVNATRAFDTETAHTAGATAFVVDAKRGILLTNRHVAQPGPTTMVAVFPDNEEIPVRVLYRDPVHDFAFLQYDPAAVRFMQPVELPLDPSGAKVGVDIRVVGNDAGEKVSILAGTLARLDRNAPDYGRNHFNDFNTFYYQAASSTSGGSSGSPVVDVRGHVVALNAGSRRSAASSYFLPLDRIVRALSLIRAGQPVPRGTLQTVFVHRTYDEVGRLGLDTATEARVRAAFPHGTGMLVVDEVVPEGPATGKLEPGDVLVKVQGRLVVDFVDLEQVLDSSVGQDITLEVQRGGEPVSVELHVGDLHAITPSEYLEAAGGVFNPFSYQQARNFALPVKGVYVASNGYSFAAGGVTGGAILTQVDGQPVPDLDALERVLEGLADRQRFTVRWFKPSDPGRIRVSVVTMDRRWFPMQRCRWDQATGTWPCTPAPPAPAAPPVKPSTTSFTLQGSRVAKALTPSLVMVDFDVPYRTDGVYGSSFRGTGVVVDARRGLVVVDRDTVPVVLGDVTLTFAGSLQVPGQVVWLHPAHNLAIVSYDPHLLGDTPIRSAKLEPAPLKVGDRIWQVGLSRGQQVVSNRTRVARIQPLEVPRPNPPFFRDSNIEVIVPEDEAPSTGGVLADGRGRVRALWASFVDLSGGEPNGSFFGLPADYVVEALRIVEQGDGVWRGIGAELGPVSLADARNRGLDEAAARVLEEHDPTRRQVLEVERLVAGTPAADALKEGDLLIEADGQPVTRFGEVERACADGIAELVVFRDGRQVPITLHAASWDGRGTDEVVGWAGALLQKPQRALAAQRGIPPEGVYVAWYWYGSPAARYKVRPTERIVAVDGIPTPDLATFLKVVEAHGDADPLALRMLDLTGRPQVVTLETDPHFWPTFVLRHGPDGWYRSTVAIRTR